MCDHPPHRFKYWDNGSSACRSTDISTLGDSLRLIVQWCVDLIIIFRLFTFLYGQHCHIWLKHYRLYYWTSAMNIWGRGLLYVWLNHQYAVCEYCDLSFCVVEVGEGDLFISSFSFLHLLLRGRGGGTCVFLSNTVHLELYNLDCCTCTVVDQIDWICRPTSTTSYEHFSIFTNIIIYILNQFYYFLFYLI